MKKEEIYIVIPAYNEQKHIKDVLLGARATGYKVIFVDDGSSDKTVEEAKKVIKDVVSHNVNLGKGSALKTGCEVAFRNGASAIVMMDSDGQHKIDDIKVFIDALNSGYEMVFGSRNLSYGVPLVRYIGNKTASLLVSFLFGVYVSDLLCGYRAFTKKAYKKVVWESTGYGVETEMVINTALSGLKYCEVPVATLYLDQVKGVTILDAFGILLSVIKWRLFK